MINRSGTGKRLFMGESETSQFGNPSINIFDSKNHAIEKDEFLLRQKCKSFLTALTSPLTTGIGSWYIRSFFDFDGDVAQRGKRLF